MILNVPASYAVDMRSRAASGSARRTMLTFIWGIRRALDAAHHMHSDVRNYRAT